MISYREKQLLAVMKYIQDGTTELSEKLNAALAATETGESYELDLAHRPPVESYEELVQLAEDAGYDCYIRADDILSPEEIADLERRKDEIEERFSSLTGLRKKDIALLFLGVGLQVARWTIITTLKPLSLDYKAELTPRNQRLAHDEGDVIAESVDELKKVKDVDGETIKKVANAQETKKRLIDQYSIRPSTAEKDYSDNSFRSVQQILFRPVPYDAETSTDQERLHLLLKKKIGGTNHRANTMGHDPVWGWIFGPINILTRSITFKSATLATFPVLEKGNIITFPKTNIISEFHAALQSIQEDTNRFAAAIVKQTLHFVADKYTKGGLPIPFLTAEKAQELIECDWNSVEAEKWIKKALHTFSNDATAIGLQFFLSHYINELIRIIHIFLCSDEDDYDPRFLEVRTKKIISASNAIASGSNVIYAVVRACVTENPIAGVQVLDIGGIVETTHRLISNTIFISKMKDEFIRSTINEDFQRRLTEAEAVI